MAEIKIEKKSNIWPWILIGLLVLAAILYFVFAEANDDEIELDDVETEQVLMEGDDMDSDMRNDSDMMAGDNVDMDMMDPKYKDNPDYQSYRTTVRAYSDYIGNKGKMGIDHVYSHGALTYLLDAVNDKAGYLDVDINADIAQARKNAMEITKDPLKTDHANLIKDTGMIIVNALEKIQTTRYPTLSTEIADVRNAVADIDKTVETLNQKSDVNMFYNEALDVLNKMK